MRDTFVIEDPQGEELAKIQERKVRVRDSMTIHLGDRKAVVKKALVGPHRALPRLGGRRV